MIAAIYARKSTEQNGVNDEEKSVTRQIAHAKAYAAKKGWAVAEAYIYADDGISGAEFTKRPGFLRLMNALKPQAPFQVLIMSEESRLGREAIETAYALKQFITGGVQVWFYLEDRQRTLESPTDKLLLSVTAFADELEREKARQRTYDAMVRKAQALHVTGGRVFGYDNIDVPSGTPDASGHLKRAHVIRQVNEPEAEIVRRIFTLCAAGKGFTSIAKTLNAEGALSPRPNPGRLKGWVPSSVREIVHRPLYRGEVVWNQSKKRDAWGRKCQRPRPKSEWLRLPAPELRIVAEKLWEAAHDRLAATRATYLRTTQGKLWGRPASGIEAKYLLTGLAQCGCCGGTLHVRSRKVGNRRAYYYGCSSYHLRGTTVCTNNVNLPKEAADQAVLTALEDDLLRPEVVEGAIRRATELWAARGGALEAQRVALRGELQQVEGELANLAAAIANGGQLTSLLVGLKEREERRTQLQEQLNTLEAAGQSVPITLGEVDGKLRGYLDNWRALLCKHAAQARQIVRKLVDGRLVFTPKNDAGVPYYEFRGQGNLGRLLEGAALLPKAMVSPAGFEPAFSA
jgi:site-specific DNA recombinase